MITPHKLAQVAASETIWTTSLIGTNRQLEGGQSMSALPGTSDINLFRYCQGVIDLNAEISHCAFDLGMPKQELDRPEIACPSIDQRRFCASQRMRAKQPRVQPDASDPVRYEPRILAGCHIAVRAATAGEQELAGPFAGGL